MNYVFPVINNIHDVLPHITEPSGSIEHFRCSDKEGITYINYNFMGPEVFPPIESDKDIRNKIRRECRGIAFDSDTGNIVSRPFHKFFNMGERPETIHDENKPHVILEKLDGSMVRPIRHPDGSIRWATKMGVTDVALGAEAFVARHPEYQEFANWCINNSMTPIFEYVGPYNRVVLDYKEDLILLSIRETDTGKYLRLGMATQLENIPVVKHKDWKWLDKEEVEGIVIRYNDGHMLKVKTEWYVSRHKAKDLMSADRGFVRAYLDGTIDDILPTLTLQDKLAVELKVFKLSSILSSLRLTAELYYNLAKSKYPTKKDFAIGTNATSDDWRRTLTFGLWDGKIASAEEGLVGILEKSLVSNTKFEETMKKLGVEL